MNRALTRILTIGGLALLLTGTAVSSAQASETGPQHQGVPGGFAAEMVPGVGDFPVSCDTVNVANDDGSITSTVACTADDATQRVEQVCVSSEDVQMGTTITRTVCSDYQPMIDALAVKDDPNTDVNQLSFGCGLTDFVCLAQETTSRNVAQWVLDSIEWVFDSSSFNTSSSLWTVATNEAGFWWSIVTFVIVGAIAVGIAAGAVLGNRKIIGRAIFGLLLTFATTWTAINSLGYVLDAVDGLTEPILAHGLTNGTMAATIQALTFPSTMSAIIQTLSPLAGLVPLLLLAGGLAVAAFVNSLRDFGLMALISFAPLAFSLMPVKLGGAWVRNWCSAIVALLLTKPLVLGLLVMVMSGIGQVESIYSIQAFPLFIGLFMTLFMPFAAFALFSFVGAQAAQSVDGAGARFAGVARTAARSVRTRAGSIGRGTPSAGGRPGTTGPQGGGSPGQRGPNGAGSRTPQQSPPTPNGRTPRGAPQGRPATLQEGRFPTSPTPPGSPR